MLLFRAQLSLSLRACVCVRVCVTFAYAFFNLITKTSSEALCVWLAWWVLFVYLYDRLR